MSALPLSPRTRHGQLGLLDVCDRPLELLLHRRAMRVHQAAPPALEPCACGRRDDAQPAWAACHARAARPGCALLQHHGLAASRVASGCSPAAAPAAAPPAAAGEAGAMPLPALPPSVMAGQPRVPALLLGPWKRCREPETAEWLPFVVWVSAACSAGAFRCADGWSACAGLIKRNRRAGDTPWGAHSTKTQHGRQASSLRARSQSHCHRHCSHHAQWAPGAPSAAGGSGRAAGGRWAGLAPLCGPVRTRGNRWRLLAAAAQLWAGSGSLALSSGALQRPSAPAGLSDGAGAHGLGPHYLPSALHAPTTRCGWRRRRRAALPAVLAGTASRAWPTCFDRFCSHCAGRSASPRSCPSTRWVDGCWAGWRCGRATVSRLSRVAVVTVRNRAPLTHAPCHPSDYQPIHQWEMVKTKEKTPEHTHVLIDLGFTVG